MLNRAGVELLSLSLRRFPFEAIRWRLIPFALRWAQSSLPNGAVREVKTRHGFRMRVRLGDWLGRHVFVRGEYEPETTQVLSALLHRGSNFTASGRSRFSLLADYQARGATWGGKMAWPKQAPERWAKLMPQCTVRERDLFGFPRPGGEYWNEQTLADVALRYPGIDMTPYGQTNPSHP